MMRPDEPLLRRIGRRACMLSALLVLSLTAFAPVPGDAAQPFFKCTQAGSVTYQSEPCPTGEVRPHPTVQQLNAERQLRLKQEAARAAASASARVPAVSERMEPAQAAPALTPAATLAQDGERRPFSFEASPGASFKCDGRKYCSQMTSCAEAKFFLARCPGVKMDSDGDGIPCERQWCGRQ